MNKIDVLLGLQWGDEGKGKGVDVLTPNYDVVMVSRGPNAGHSLSLINANMFCILYLQGFFIRIV